ncbi:MAG: hypothetical protein QOE59_3377 [Actinomycetota bacterium]|jgi:hypothetical protein|nr:hypothetical protein [Actinomycetota bacterium]
MAPTAQSTAPAVSPAHGPRQPTGTTTEPWREAVVGYRPPAGPDGCWASPLPRELPTPRDHAV